MNGKFKYHDALTSLDLQVGMTLKN